MPVHSANDAVLAQFTRLMTEQTTGRIQRTKFQSWEIEILLDIESCKLRSAAKRQAVKEYQDEVAAQLERGAPAPIKFSAFLKDREAARVERMPASSASQPKTRDTAKRR